MIALSTGFPELAVIFISVFKNIIKEPTIKFSYSNMLTEYQFLNDGNHLLLEGDFGYVTYDDINYFSSEIRFFAQSMHSVLFIFINFNILV